MKNENKLYSGYPCEIEVNGVKYPVNTDFRLMMRFELASQKKDRDALIKIISEFYSGNMPDDPDAAVDGIISFYLCGEKKDTAGGSGNNRRCYAFDEDSRYICAAFRQQYGIDLNSARMHWWEFSSLFAGLTDMTEFVKIMQYRCADVRKIKNDAEKARIKRLQRQFALSENRIKHYASAAEREKAMIEEARQKLFGKR